MDSNDKAKNIAKPSLKSDQIISKDAKILTSQKLQAKAKRLGKQNQNSSTMEAQGTVENGEPESVIVEETNEALSKEQKSGVIKQSLRLKISKVFNKKNV